MRRLLGFTAVALGLLVPVLSCGPDRVVAPKFLRGGGFASDLPGLIGPAVVISQVYGGGGNSGAPVKNDFIELFNRGAAPVSLSGWSMQYQSANGTGNWLTTPLSGTIQPGRFFLIQEAAGAGVQPLLPTPDVSGAIAMSATDAKVALVQSTTLLTGGCPTGGSILGSVVSYGTTSCSPRSTPALSNTLGATRSDLCTYVDDPAAAFVRVAPAARNSSVSQSCGASVAVTPSAVTLTPTESQTFLATARDANGNPVTTTFGWSSDNIAAATVNSSGVATAVAEGVATITATAANGVAGSATFTVVVPASIVVTPNPATAGPGTSRTFSADVRNAANEQITPKLTWSSSNTAVATVDDAGIVNALTVGQTTIKATAANGVFGTADLTVAVPPPVDVVISQVYGGGGNAGSTFTNDFIELFNRGSQAVNLGGWSVQYNSSTGSGTWQVTPLTGTIQPGRYFLVQEAEGTGGTVPLFPDAAGTIAMGGTAGKVLLSRSTTAFTGACPSDPNLPSVPDLLDRVGYGTASNCGTVWGGTTPTLTNSTSAFRKNDGCVNSGNNGSDFQAFTTLPRNTSSPAKNCNQPTRTQSSATIVINELMGDPANATSASWGQWFEVYNYGTAPVDLSGWTIVSPGTSQPDHVIDRSVIVPAGGYAVLGRATDRSQNGDVAVDYNYFVGNANTLWLDDADFVMLVDAAGARVDSVAWTSLPRGSTKGLRDASQPHADVDGANWGFSTASFGNGDYGTPGAANAPLANSPIFVSPNHINITGRLATDPAIPVGFEDQIFANEFTPANVFVTGVTFTWTALTPNIATIDERGVMHSVSPGTAVFRVVSSDGAFRNVPFAMEAGVLSATANYGNNTEFGAPTPGVTDNDWIVVHDQFTSSYNRSRGSPNWVAYDLDGSHIGSAVDRCDCFTHDPLLPARFEQLSTADYTGSAAFLGLVNPETVDRGHMTRSSDRTAGTLDNAITYLLSNVVPQFGDLNQGPWNNFEQYLHDLAKLSNKEIYVVTGPFGNAGTLKNEGKIVMPTHTWKVAVIMPRDQGLANVHTIADLQVLAVVMPNVDPRVEDIRGVPWETYLTTVDAVESMTGYDFLALLPDQVEIAVESNTKPPIAATDGPYAAVEGGPSITMSAAGSSDPDGDAITFAWNFGDGQTATGISASHTYAKYGTYTLTLTATDTRGLTNSVITTTTVSNVAPSIGVIAGATILAGGTFTAAGSFTDPGSGDWTATVDYGDLTGTQPLVLGAGHSFALSHTYAISGTFAVTVRVSDGDATAEQNASVRVQARPVANAGGTYSGIEGSTVAFNAGLSADADGTIVSYAWTFGDGAVGSGVSASHAYAQNGTYTVGLTVADNDGLTNTITTTVNVANAVPVITTFTGSAASLVSGGALSVSGAFSDAGVNDAPWGYSFTWGEGSPTAGSTMSQATILGASHTYLRAGNYTVSQTVTDKDLGSGSRSLSVEVLRLAVQGQIDPDGFRLRNDGVTGTFTVLSSATFDARSIVPGSARIGIVGVAKDKKGNFLTKAKDENKDKRLDLNLEFSIKELIAAGQLRLDTKELVLTADLTDGRQITARASLRPLVAKKDD